MERWDCMDKTEKANQRARFAITALLIAMDPPKNDEERRELVLDWENKSLGQLIQAMNYNLEWSPYRNSVLTRHAREHAQWCIREIEQVKASKQREVVHV